MAILTILPRRHAGPVSLGASRDEVRRAMAVFGLALSHVRNRLDYFGDDNSIQVEYIDETASFIGIASSGVIQWTIFGADPFDLPADKLVALLTERNGSASETPAGPLFRTLIVTLYEADEQYDWIARRAGKKPRFPVWGQIGIGDERYLAAVDAIDGRAVSQRP